MKKSLVLLGFLLLTVVSCDNSNLNVKRKNAQTVEKAYPFQNFNSIKVQGAVSVELTQDPNYTISVITTEENQKNLIVEVKDSVLFISQKGNIIQLFEDEKIKIKIKLPQLKNVESEGGISLTTKNNFDLTYPLTLISSGASSIKMNVNAPNINIESSGAGSMRLKGSVKDLNIDVSGASSLSLKTLTAEHVNVDASGATNLSVSAVKTLNIDISGAGSVRYYGNPILISKKEGISSIKRSGGIDSSSIYVEEKNISDSLNTDSSTTY